MKSVLGKTWSAVALAAVMAASATPAQARPHWGRHHRHGGDDAAWAIGGGLIGLGIGAAIASSGRHLGDRYYGDYDRGGYYGGYDRGYYGGGYYGGGYDAGYDRGYYRDGYREHYAGGDCRSHRVYDRYLRRTVRVSYCE